MTKIILATLLLFISSIGLAQENETKKKKNRPKKQKYALSQEQIFQLKEGALLVRLKTKKNTIEALRKIGKNITADKIEKNQLEINRSIIDAFKAHFNFCPTYFFYSDNSVNVRDKEFNKVIFINSNLSADSTIKFENKYFLIAEFGTIEQDTIKHFSHYSYESKKDWSLTKVKNYSGGSNIGFGALIIKNDKFIQLSRPFPYYVRTFDSLPITRSNNKVVKKMNKKLNKFYIKKTKQ